MPARSVASAQRADEIVASSAARLSGSPDLAATLRGIASVARSALGADRATCYVHDVVAGVVTAVYSTESDPDRRAFLERTVGMEIAQLPILRLQLAEDDALVAIEDIAASPSLPPALVARLGSGALIGARLEHSSVGDDRSPPLLGTLYCSYTRPQVFSKGQLQAARGLANLAALGLANAHLQAQTAESLAAASVASAAIQHQRDYSTALVASMQDGLTVLSPTGVLLEVSPSFCRLTGFTRDELIGSSCPYPYWPDAEIERLERAFRQIREINAGEWDLEFRRKDGRRFPVIVGASLLRSEEGEVLGYLGTVKDITDRKRAEQALERSLAESAALAAEQAALRRVATLVAAEASPEVVFAQAAEEAAGLLGVDAAIVARFTADAALVVGRWGARLPAGDLALPLGGAGALAAVARSARVARVTDYAPLVGEATAEIALCGGYRSGVAAPVRVGGLLWGGILAATNREKQIDAGAESRLERFADLMALAIANTEARARLEAQAASDPLTGLLNHRSFHERLGVETAEAQLHRRDLSLVLFDLDRFKRINDERGHQTGDAVLAEVARRLSGLTRAGDVLARVGGEEFALLLPATGALDAWQIAERGREGVRAHPIPDVGTVTVSAGICSLSEAGSSDDLYRFADGALYWAKGHGRDVCIRYDSEVVHALSAEERAVRLERSQALNAIRVLARAVDARDRSTQRHSERVADLSVMLATASGWPIAQSAQLREAALVHDVGKIGVPDGVLLKPGSLTADERTLIETHAALGAQMVADVLSHEQVAWVRHHHERDDGAGYPDGIAGDDIPEGARLLAVADCWDAMTADRPYRRALTPTQTLEEFRRGAGTQWSAPAVVALMRLWDAGALTPGP